MKESNEDTSRAEEYFRGSTSTLALALRGLIDVYPDLPPVMVVGAECRDALHRACGYEFALRRTTDLDIALVVRNFDHLRELTSLLNPVKGATNGIRYWVSDIPVDLIPFGEDVEHPDGAVTPPPRPDAMSVFGFQDVWDSALQVDVAGAPTVRLPSVAGYTALKLRAWLDRAPAHSYKDGPDLASAMYWYVDPKNTRGPFTSSLQDRLYDTEEGRGHLEAAEWAPDTALVRLLVDDAAHVLSTERRNALRSDWEAGPEDLVLASQLRSAELDGWPLKGSERLTTYAGAVRGVLAAP